jgi:hypothetical protein
VYSQLRQLRLGEQSAVAENFVWRREAGTFRFRDGRFSFAAPVGGRVVAAVFIGQASFELNPPTPIARRQISRFTREAKLEDSFRKAVFFFTDDSWAELGKLVQVAAAGDSQAAGKLLESAQRKYAESFNGWWANSRKGNFAMRNVPARMLADLTDLSSRGFFLADFEGERYGNLLYHVSWNRDPVVLPGFATDEEVILVHYQRDNYYEWWGGFHREDEYRRSAFPEHRALVARCHRERLEAEISPDNRLSAAAELEVQVPGGSVRLLPLNLEGVLRIESLTDAAGNNLRFIQEARELDSDPWVILSETPAANRVYNLRLRYQEDSTHDSRIIHQQGAGLYYVTARESWFPSFGDFDDRTQFSLSFRSPKKFKFVATGRMTQSEKKGDFFQTRWESEIALGVVGFNYGDFVEGVKSDANLSVTAYSGKEVPDELKGLQAAIDMAELSQGTGHMSNLAGRLGIPTEGFNTSRLVGYAAEVSFQALKLFESYFGLLPFKNVSVTEQPVRGYGQSWPTLIFLPYDSLLDATTRHGLRLQDTAEAREFYNIVAVHEMAHQWWGHLVGWKTYHDQWLSEGFAEFSAALFLRKFDPKKWNGFWELKKKWLLSSNQAGHRPTDVGPLWLNYQLNAHLEP